MAPRKRSRAPRSSARKTTTRKPARKAAARKTATRRAKPAARKARKPAAAKRRAAPRRGAAAKGGAAPAGAIGMMVQHLDYTSQSMDEIKRFYTELLGFTKFNHMTGEMNYLRVETGPSSSLGFMPPMEGAPEQWRPPREPNLYLIVKDVDAAYRAIAARGVTFDDPPQNMPWGHRVANLRDPEGRRVCLAQVLER